MGEEEDEGTMDAGKDGDSTIFYGKDEEGGEATTRSLRRRNNRRTYKCRWVKGPRAGSMV